MPKTLFDIGTSDAPADWPRCHLVMEISPRIFSYALMNADKKVLRLRFYELDAINNNRLAAELDEIVAADEILKANVEQGTLLYNFPESQFIPEEHFIADNNQALTELLYGDLHNRTTFSEKVNGFNRYNVFSVPGEVLEALRRHFPNSEYRHYYTQWIECNQHQPIERPSYVSVIFYPNRILISAVKENLHCVLQSYEYEAAEDVGYYMLNICNQLQLPPATTPVLLSGMIDVSSALYTEIFKYFGQLIMEDYSGFADTPALQEFPAHFFSPLLKLSTCVS